MNLSPRWREHLAGAGHECVHWSEVGPANATDEEILAWVRDRNHVLFTHDLDFGRLLALTHALGPSVIQLRARDVLPAACARNLVEALAACEDELLAGALVVVDETTWRARVLPISR